MFGGAVLIGIVTLICVFSLNLHTYNVMLVNNQQTNLTLDKSKIELIKELQKDKIILTPQEYTNNIASYYNTAITLLVFLFIIFSFISYFHLKFLSKEQITKALDERIRDSKELERIIIEAFSGKADERYETIENIQVLRDLVDSHETILNSFNSEVEKFKDSKIIVTNGSKRPKNNK